jgi:ribosomal protein S18 acetylase RimI-like enzyme
MPQGEVRIRRARSPDTDAVSKLLRRAFAEFKRDFYWPGSWDSYISDVADVDGRRSRSQLWVAELDGSIAGSVDYYPPGNAAYHPRITFPATWAAFRCLATDPARRGAGIGRSLVEHLVTLGRRDGATHLVLHSIPLMTAAVSMYRRIGFERLPGHDFRPRADSPHRWQAYGLAVDSYIDQRTQPGRRPGPGGGCLPPH